MQKQTSMWEFDQANSITRMAWKKYGLASILANANESSFHV